MSQLEPDPQFIQGLRLLHSSHNDSADQLRTLLDEAIKLKHGSTKMLCNVLHKKYTMEEPVLSDHSSSSSKKSKSSSSSSKHSSKSSKSASPEDVAARDTPTTDILQTDDTLALEILEDDLTCIVCKGMDVGARNRLVECVDCHALYHQECHNPPIQDAQIDVPRLVWYCANCLKTHPPTKERNSPKTVIEVKTKETKKSSGSSKHAEKYKNLSSQSSSSNIGSSATINLPKPNIHIIAGDRRIKDVGKKSKDKRGSSNGTSSSKHSNSGSSSSSKSSQDKSSSHKSKVAVD